MVVEYPRNDVLQNMGIVSQSFSLLARSELSRQRNGVAIPKRLGSSIWVGEWTSKDKKHDLALDFEAILNSLDDGLQTFYAYDTRRRMPLKYPTGNFDDTGTIRTIHSSRSALSFGGFEPGLELSRGDYFCFTYNTTEVALHQLMESAVVDGSGDTPEITVRPHIRPGATLNTGVNFKNPYGRFRLFPQTITLGTVNILQSNASIKAYQDFA